MKKQINILLFLILFSSSFFAQNLNQKIKNIKGKVETITIKTDDGEYNFSGDEAKKLFKKIKGIKKLIHIDEFDSDVDSDLIWFEKDDDGEIEIMMTKECSIETEDGVTVKLEVEKNGDEVFVSEYITENGESKINKYEGDEAKEVLGRNKKQYRLSIGCETDSTKVFSINKEFFDTDENLIKMEIDIEEENGVKTLKVITKKNGEEETKIYTGDEAEEFLAKHDSDYLKIKKFDSDLECDVFIIKESVDTEKKIEKKIRKKIIEEKKKK